MLTLRSQLTDSIPVSFAGIKPEAVAEKSLGEIEKLPVWHGNRQLPLAELFKVSGDASDRAWRLEGDFSSVHHIGAEMTAGEIRAIGTVGRHAGRAMRGGTLAIEGDAGDWLGGEMRGGRIDLAGNAGNHLGAAYTGSKVGMRGGAILVRGNTGTHAAAGMRRGWVTVLGDCGEWAGYRMRAGSLLVLGSCGPRPGAEMRRGTIALLGAAPTLLPTFRYACHYQPQALALMLHELKGQGVDLDPTAAATVALYHGDLLEGGRGEIWSA